MSACPPLNYSGVTAYQWVAIRAAIADKIGITITADSGTDTARGFTVSWAYKPGSLTVICIDSPWEDPCLFINVQIDGTIRPLLVTSP